MSAFIGQDEDLKVTKRHESALSSIISLPLDSTLKPLKISIYPLIDPQVHYDNQTYAGKVVLITGASRGVGLETAIYYARAGASVTIVARKQETLDISRDAILHEQPSAQVLTFPADVRDVKKAGEAVAATVARFGRLDILVANAGVVRPGTARSFVHHIIIWLLLTEAWKISAFVSKDPTGWWEVLEINIRGAYNFIQFVHSRIMNYS
jgi:NAD(P)-dependent dehydrogenase (short-subunit alcohol dehydrogenase family)